jgi:hypothetical protein
MNTISTSTAGDVVAIDGKTLRGSYNRHDRQSTIHMVSAFATANGVVMGKLNRMKLPPYPPCWHYLK